MDGLERWRRAVVAWNASGGPRVRREARSADAETTVPPGSRSFARECEALPDRGTVLDVGCGSGGASLPLAGHAGLIVGVDREEHLLAALRRNAESAGVPVRTVRGSWPEVEVPPADVVVCHHVLYGAADLAPFAAALTGHARRRVVIEIPERHPQHALSPLWERFHGVARPAPPTADDAVEALRAAGVRPECETWVDEQGWGGYPDLAALTERVRRRLGLPPERTDDVTAALLELGVDPCPPGGRVAFPGTIGRTLVTIWWDR
ncbi:class I SAM-dependent methyltransferase [Actinoallomurus sp. CA-150999]|uniref:class I SAM-dependent methyltransferase n=1 Tax=Actinoallomurus sp. CA-150999 TaxID=3239887 RepID=UPI003D8BB8B3